MSRTPDGSLRSIGRAAGFALTIVVGANSAQAQIAPKAPEPATLKANAEMAKNLPFANRQDFDDAMQGFVGTVPDALVPGTGNARRSGA